MIEKTYPHPVDIIHWCDAHAENGETDEDLDRHRALGWFISHYRRAVSRRVICVNGGDQGDFPSFNPHTGTPLRANKSGFRTNKKLDAWGDIEAFKTSLRLTLDPICETDKEFMDAGLRDMCSDIYITAGNHEHYITQTSYELGPLASIFKREDFDLKTFCLSHGMRWVDFMEGLVINGIWFQHVHKHKGQRLTVQTLFNRYDIPIVVGDKHEQVLITGRGPDGRPRFAYSNGAWLSKNYSGAEPHEYDRGLTIFKNVQDGLCDIEWIRQDTILAEYHKNEARKKAAQFSIAV